jgi:hypothetical protein
MIPNYTPQEQRSGHVHLLTFLEGNMLAPRHCQAPLSNSLETYPCSLSCGYGPLPVVTLTSCFSQSSRVWLTAIKNQSQLAIVDVYKVFTHRNE